MFRIISAFSKTNSIPLIICLLSFFIFNSAFSQQKNTIIEDDYETLKAKIRLYFNASGDRALMYAEQMAKSSNYEHLAFANGVMTVFFQEKGNTKEAQKRYMAALYYLKKMPDSRNKIQMKSYIYNYGAIAESSRGNYGKALENYQLGLKYATQINDIKQIIKIQGNIALLNEAVGNYKLSIKKIKYLIDFVSKNETFFTKTELLNFRSNYYFGLASAYEGYFMKNLTQRYLLDSAEYYYKKTINYSQKFATNKISSQLSLGNVYNWKQDFKNAEKMYYEVIFSAQQNNLIAILGTANYNLGDIYYTTKNYNKALVYYKKCDSIAMISNDNTLDYLKSNFYQSKIYTILKQPTLAYKHSKIYLDNYEKYEAGMSKEALEVNYKQGVNDLTVEMRSIEKKYKEDIYITRFLTIFYVILFIGVVFFLIRSIKDKRKTQTKMISLIMANKVGKENKNYPDKKIVSFHTKKGNAKNVNSCSKDFI